MAKATLKEEDKVEMPPPAPETNLPAAQQGRDIQTYEEFEHSGQGMEGIGIDEFKLPFLRVLDPKSPQVAPPERGGVEGAKPGDILLGGLNEIWRGGKGIKNGFYFVPVEREQRFVEWIPRDPQTGTGGGFVQAHMPDEQIVGELRAMQGKFGKLKMDNGHELAQTFTLFCLIAQVDHPDNWQEAMIFFASTQIPKYQTIVNRTRGFKYPVKGPDGKVNLRMPAFWQHKWHMGTQMDPPNRRGQTWYGWVPELAARDAEGKEDHDFKKSFVPQWLANGGDGPRDLNPLYQQAHEFYKIIAAGKIKTNYAQSEEGEPQGGREPGDERDDIPM